jgi:hypothetical protein
MKKASLAVQPRASSSYSERSISFSTACMVSSAILPSLPDHPWVSCMKISTHALSLKRTYGRGGTLPALPVRPWRSCMKVSTPALSLKRTYGRGGTPMFSMDAITVAWSTVQVNSHEVMLGDHPSVSSGPPLAIKWTALHSYEVTVDNYEKRRPYHRSPEDLLLPKAVREGMLRKQGYPPRQLKIAIRAVNKIKRRRQSSAGDGRGWRWRWSWSQGWRHTVQSGFMDHNTRSRGKLNQTNIG